MSDERPKSNAEFNRKIIEEFRAGGGLVGGVFEGFPLVLVTSTGARSGQPRTNPVAYARDGGRILIFGSNGGAHRHPDWYWNVLADPRVTVEIGDGEGGVETYAGIATVLEGEERARLYREQGERVPAFAAYQAGTERVIPVVALERSEPGTAG
ncbi:nitroreductase family deazaflavin-dependent oxidoreductase [Streptomyces sp. NPDC006798]|uniref:nitroreductase family deazaflavin-dependent oxidoreductase n=1 Tax=Streptomyces sp. NPDC006798 TaxID=3155462 RepID=UPI0033D4EDE6